MLLSPDLANATFEGAASFFILLNVRRILRDKLVRGTDWRVMAFFAAWGYWNLFYYPYLGQWLSFAAGLGTVVTDTAYLALMIYYVRKEDTT